MTGKQKCLVNQQTSLPGQNTKSPTKNKAKIKNQSNKMLKLGLDKCRYISNKQYFECGCGHLTCLNTVQ